MPVHFHVKWREKNQFMSLFQYIVELTIHKQNYFKGRRYSNKGDNFSIQLFNREMRGDWVNSAGKMLLKLSRKQCKGVGDGRSNEF